MKSTFIILSINVIFVLVFSKSLKNFEEMKKCEKSFKKIQKFRFLDKSEDEPSDWNSESEIESESESAESENESESAESEIESESAESEIESESAESEIESESAESENESESAESENESESAQSEIESESAESESESESKAESESESESKAESESESEFSGNQTVDEPEITVPITAPSTLPQPNRDAQVSIIGYNNFIFQENSISNYLIMFVLRIFFNGLPEPPRKVTMTLIVASTSTSLRLLEKQDNKDVEAECLIIEDNKEGTLYNMVGFQTNLKFGEQKRVFSMIPALKNAEFVKYGVMHRNTYINSPELLDNTYQLKNTTLFFAGQISGVEGYVESISSGLVAGINAVNLLRKEEKIVFPVETMIGALADYITTPNQHFQPMNANFGILNCDKKIKNKVEKYEYLANRSLSFFEKSC